MSGGRPPIAHRIPGGGRAEKRHVELDEVWLQAGTGRLASSPRRNVMSDEQAQVDEEMEQADVANGEGPPEKANKTERRYGEDESPA